MKPKDLNALADRIDHEQLWRGNPFARDRLTQDQRDRLDAGVNLRRYASELGIADQKRAEGREYMRGYKFTRYEFGTYTRGCADRDWHRALNRYSEDRRLAGEAWLGWLYTAMTVSDEVPRMILLFENERTGLPQRWKMCGHERDFTQLHDNHLRCALGQACRSCPHLQAIEQQPAMSNEAKDEAKAWTCATHILLESKVDAYFEQFLRDQRDDLMDSRMARAFGPDFGDTHEEPHP